MDLATLSKPANPLSHVLACRSCPQQPEIAATQGRLTPEVVTMFCALHEGHDLYQAVLDPTPEEMARAESASALR